MNAPAEPNPLAEDLADVLARTSGLWEAVRGRSLFVTGGTGFFGRWLLESFVHASAALDLGATLVVLSRDPAGFLRRAPHLIGDPAVRFVAGDVRTFTAADVHRQLGDGTSRRFAGVIHAATDTDARVQADDPLLTLETVIQGTRAALDFAVATDAKRFLLTSSGAVYGPQPDDVSHLSEEYPGGPDCARPASAYAEGKRAAELLCACYHQRHGLEPLIARCFAFAGPFLPLDGHFAIGNFIRDALRGQAIRIAGDGTPFRSYLYAADLAVWLWTILWRGEPMRPYNVGSGEAVSILELARTVARTLAVRAAPQVALPPCPKTAPARYVPSVERAAAELGLTVHTSLPDAIRKTARWAKAQGLNG